MPQKIAILLALLVGLSSREVGAEAKAHSTSSSRQFFVYGADIRVRGAVCDIAETTKKNLLKLLRLPDRWKTPLVINLDYPQANVPELPPSRFDFSQTGSGLKLQLNLLISGDLNGREVQRELLSAILIEMIYRPRTNVPSGSRYVVPPDWLVDGIVQSMPGCDPDEAAQLLQTMVASDCIAPLDEVVRQRRELLDPASRKIHDAYSMALVQLLLDSPDGRHQLAHYLADLPDAPNDSVADLRTHFPTSLGRGVGKWWALSVAHLSASDRYEMLSAAETARRLDQLLRFSIPAPGGQAQEYSLGDYSAYLKLPASRPVLRQLSEQLLLLGARAHPSYRAIVQECYQLATLLARGKTHKVTQRLARVATYREVVEQQGRAMDDYLNWYEATQLKTMSGAFVQVLKDAREEDQPLRRRDPISVYLDAIEAGL
jgi:hypothetical protein